MLTAGLRALNILCASSLMQRYKLDFNFFSASIRFFLLTSPGSAEIAVASKVLSKYKPSGSMSYFAINPQWNFVIRSSQYDGGSCVRASENDNMYSGFFLPPFLSAGYAMLKIQKV